MTNTVMPVGGLIRPIVHITVTKMPNQMPSKPMPLISGSVTGTVIRMVLTSSRNVPSSDIERDHRHQDPERRRGRPPGPTPASSFGNCVSTMKREKMKAPTTMKKIAAVV